jgi:flagellar FliL protein
MDRSVPAAPAKTPPGKPGAVAPEAPPPKKPRLSKKLLFILLSLVAVIAAGGGAAFWLLKPSSPATAKPAGPAQYIALEPAFVVNLADDGAARYLQADVQLQTRDADTAAAVALHTPIIRNKLLLLFGQQTSQQLVGRNGKEQLQAQALAEVKNTLRAQHAASQVDALLFTSIVIQ